MRKNRRHLLVLVVGLMLSYPCFLLQAKQHPVDNLTIFNSMASTVVQKVIDKLSPDSSASILIHSQSQQHIGNWWLENWFVKVLSQKGLSKIHINEMESNTMLVLQFKILDLKVAYIPTDKKKMIERKFNLSLSVRAFDGSSGLIRFMDKISEQYADSIQIKDVSRLENRDYHFTQASLPEEKGIKKFIEPLIVMSTTAGIVYLFFRLRSN